MSKYFLNMKRILFHVVGVSLTCLEFCPVKCHYLISFVFLRKQSVLCVVSFVAVFRKHIGQNAVCLSFSPLAVYVAVGVKNRPELRHSNR